MNEMNEIKEEKMKLISRKPKPRPIIDIGSRSYFNDDLTDKIHEQQVQWVMGGNPDRNPYDTEITDMCNSITETYDIPCDQDWIELMDYCRGYLNRLFEGDK